MDDHTQQQITRIIDATHVLFRRDGRRLPSQVGTGVAVRIAREVFILTAGHVIWDFGDAPIHAAINGRFIQLNCRALATLPPGGDVEADKDDVGVLWLAGGAPDDFGALSLEEISARDDGELSQLVLLSYPCSFAKLDVETKRLTLKHFRFTGRPASGEELERSARRPSQHVGLYYDHARVKSEDGRRTAPSLKCASGGGIWLLANPAKGADVGPRLMAIFTDRIQSSRLLVGTRVGAQCNVIAEEFPDLRAAVAGATTDAWSFIIRDQDATR